MLSFYGIKGRVNLLLCPSTVYSLFLNIICIILQTITYSPTLTLYLLLVSRVSSLSASGRSYGETSAQNPSSANGRILSQPSTSDKDSITYPDDIIRDSYGNIVTPYTTLVDDAATLHASSPKPSNVGPLTDVNKDNGQHLQFVIPSYSDGITELQGPYKPYAGAAAIAPPLQTLLPPLSSGNYNYPNLDAHKISPDNSYQNEVGSSFQSSAQSINPVPTGPTAITTNGHIGSASTSPNIYTPDLQLPFSSPSAVANQPIQSTSYDQQFQTQPTSGTFSLFSKPIFTPTNNPTVNSPTQGSSDFSSIHVSSPEQNAPSSSFSFTNSKPLKDTQFVNQIPINIQVESGKYTAGFGGAPGILGEQKVPGYAVKPSVNIPTLSTSIPQVSNDHPGLNSVHAHSPHNSPNQGTQNALSHASQQTVLPNQNFHQGNLAPAKPNNINQSGTFGQPNTNHGSFQFGTAISPNPTINSQISNNSKYTDGFGGPPGIYSPFDNVKTGKNVANDDSTGNLNEISLVLLDNN